MAVETTKRRYQLRQRAEAMADTRRRITEAAVELHGALGPARTTVSAIAQRAGVQRHTVYRHFPTELDLFAACSSLHMASHPRPDLDAWGEIEDPRARLETALDELYRWYEEIEPVMTSVLRDEDLVEAVATTLIPFHAYGEDATRALAAGWPARGPRRRVLLAALRHAVDFHAWRSLVLDGGISRAQGVRLASAMVEAAASG